MKTRLRILTDLLPAGTFRSSETGIDFEVLSLAEGLRGLRATLRAFVSSFSFDYALFRYETPGIYAFCLLKSLAPFHRCRLVTVDLFTPPPGSWASRLKLRIVSLLLRNVHRFFVHVRDSSRYERTLRLPRCRFRYIAYKVNQYDLVRTMQTSDQRYVFSGGVSRRDFATLFEAVRGLPPYPVIVVTRPDEVLAAHGSTLDEATAPPNVQVIRTNGGMRPFLDYMAGSRLVVIPLRKDTVAQAGIAVYLVAMALGKCVVVSSGPGVDDVLEQSQAIIVPPGDSDSLRTAIERAYTDDAYRRSFEERGRAYAARLGGDDRFRESLLDAIASDYQE